MASLISILPLVFVLFTTLNHLSEAKIIIVGGSLNAWKVPESSNNTLNQWAAKVRFQVGDILLFAYDNKNDSVLEVTKENYESCNMEKPLKEYKDGNNKVKLEVSGPHYFISGANSTGNCGKGEKLDVVVQSPNHPPVPKPAHGAAPPTPSAKPATTPAPAPAKSTAFGLVAGSGIFWASILVAVFGLIAA